MRFGVADLSGLRALVAERSAAAGLDPKRSQDTVLAVNELATNSIRYAGGTGELRLWASDGQLICEVRDSAQISGPLPGSVQPAPDSLAGRGLWLVKQLCGRVDISSGPGGTIVRVHMTLGDGTYRMGTVSRARTQQIRAKVSDGGDGQRRPVGASHCDPPSAAPHHGGRQHVNADPSARS